MNYDQPSLTTYVLYIVSTTTTTTTTNITERLNPSTSRYLLLVTSSQRYRKEELSTFPTETINSLVSYRCWVYYSVMIARMIINTSNLYPSIHLSVYIDWISYIELMQDSLGGNAKTLMFVNFSPADYNADETSTSLMYASRVKKIVNNASKVSYMDVNNIT